MEEVIVHRYTGFISEDGDPKVDADGVKNGTVVWKAGAVHVINGSYLVEGEQCQSRCLQAGLFRTR
jgi:hypothetical protein